MSNDQSPIEYVGDRTKRGRRQRRERQQRLRQEQQQQARSQAAAARATARADAAAKSNRFGILLLFGICGFIAAWVLHGVYGQTVRREIADYLCDVTGCRAEGMITAGWLIVAVPAICLALVVGLWRRMSTLVRTLALIVLVPLLWVALTFYRRTDTGLVLNASKAGRHFADGIVWGLIGFGASVAVLLLFSWLSNKRAEPSRAYTAVALASMAIVMAASLPLGLSRATPTFVTADGIFPATFQASGDTLTRFVSAEEPGCANVIDDASLLTRHGCQLTVVGGYRTDDSDAQAIVTAVLFGSQKDVKAARASVPAEPKSAGRTGDTITVVSVSGFWLIVGRVTHADRAPIAADERPWLLWTLKQVSYRFIGVQQGMNVGPSPADGIAPRTP